MKLLSLKELSCALGKSEESIRYHIRRGRIAPTGRLGRVYVFNLESVLKQLQRGVKAPQQS